MTPLDCKVAVYYLDYEIDAFIKATYEVLYEGPLVSRLKAALSHLEHVDLRALPDRKMRAKWQAVAAELAGRACEQQTGSTSFQEAAVEAWLHTQDETKLVQLAELLAGTLLDLVRTQTTVLAESGVVPGGTWREEINCSISHFLAGREPRPG
jgi:hypothetical protein